MRMASYAETINKLADRSIPLLERLRLLQASTPARSVMHEAANRIEELEIRVAVLETAARVVTSFDWSDNDEDAVRTMDALRILVK